VLLVRDRTGARWYAERLTQRHWWEAEVAGYRMWGDLPEVPTLRAACSRRRCVLVPEVPGREPSGQSRRVMRTAGALLRCLHETESPTGSLKASWRDLAPADTDRRLRWRVRRLHVFDFGAVALRPAAYDLGRLQFASCWHRPGVSEALMEGYGRELSASEVRFVRSLLPWRAVVAISIGVRHRRPRMVEHGRLVLDSLADR